MYNMTRNVNTQPDRNKVNKMITLNYNNELFVLDEFRTHMEHNKEYYTARINICDKTGVLQTQVKPVLYCKTCGKFFIYKSYLKQLNENGIPLTRINSGKQGIGDLREESPLKLMGYNVSRKKGLNPKQRRFVLRYILEKKYMSKERILSYLKFFLRNPVAGETARGKWLEDIGYVESII